MPTNQDRIPAVLAEITSLLAGAHTPDAVLRLVTRACGDLLGATSTGIVLADPRGGLRLAIASDERTRFIELLQAHLEQGPCVDCIEAGEAVHAADLADALRHWPDFAEAALAKGFRAVHAAPMILDGSTVGGLNLFFSGARVLSAPQVSLSRLLADLAVLALSQDRDPRRTDRLVERTLSTLNGRVELAQAVGLVAGVLGIEPDDAREALSQYADRHGGPVEELARALTSGALHPAELLPPVPER